MTVSLKKGGKISLEKEAPGLTKAVFGLGWGMQEKKRFFGGTKLVEIDLDAACLLFDGNNALVDQVWFQQLRSIDGSVVHTGDDLVGGGAAGEPNEEIIVNLNAVPTKVQTLVFTVNSFSSDTFDGIPNAFCVLRDSGSGREVARYNLSVEGGGHTGLVISKLFRNNQTWDFEAIGLWGQGRTFSTLLPIIENLL